MTTLWLKLYKEFIEAIDAIDNGISQYPNDISPKYRSRTDLSSRVGWLNPTWNQSVDSKSVDVRVTSCSPQCNQLNIWQALFEKASTLTGEEFLGRLDYYAKAWLPARDLVVSALAARTNVDPSGKIVLFEQYAPWKVCIAHDISSPLLTAPQEHLFEIEQELNLEEDLKPVYVVYADETAGNWRVQAVPVSPESFESRKALPEAWRGLRDAELSKASGIDGGIFIHASGFIGGEPKLYLCCEALLPRLPQVIKPRRER